MNISKIQASDLAGFHALFAEVSGEGLFSVSTQAPPIQAIERALVAVEQHDWPVYVAVQNGQIVGSAEAFPDSFCRPQGDPQVGLLGMQVKRTFRRHGHGTALLEAVMRHARRIGFTGIELTVLKSNHAALALYDKVGFTWLQDLDTCVLPGGVQDQLQRMRLAF